MDRGAWQGTVHKRHKKSDTTEWISMHKWYTVHHTLSYIVLAYSYPLFDSKSSATDWCLWDSLVPSTLSSRDSFTNDVMTYWLVGCDWNTIPINVAVSPIGKMNGSENQWLEWLVTSSLYSNIYLHNISNFFTKRPGSMDFKIIPLKGLHTFY